MPPENHDARKLVKQQVPMPICVGERLVTRWDFRPILDKQLANYIMPDIVRCGGISEMRKIATMAEAYYIPVSPHDATGPITMAAGAQVLMSTQKLLPTRNRLLRTPLLQRRPNPSPRRPQRHLPRVGRTRPRPRTEPRLHSGGT